MFRAAPEGPWGWSGESRGSGGQPGQQRGGFGGAPARCRGEHWGVMVGSLQGSGGALWYAGRVSKEALAQHREERWERHRRREGGAKEARAGGITGRDPGEHAGSIVGVGEHQEGYREGKPPEGYNEHGGHQYCGSC